VVEDNTIVNLQTTHQAAILVGTGVYDPGDEPDTGAIVRFNTIYFSQAHNNSIGVDSKVGANLQTVSNLIYFGASSDASHRCFGQGALSSYAAFDHNLCYHAAGNGVWSPTYGTLAQAQAAGFDVSGLSVDPQFTAPPTAPTWACTLQPNSPAVGFGKR
jgi:hypothetical protein